MKQPEKEKKKEDRHKIIRIMGSTREEKIVLKEGPYKCRLCKLKVELFCIKWDMELLLNRDVCSPMPISVLYLSVMYNCGM